MTNEYEEATNRILSEWREYAWCVNDYLPDVDYAYWHLPESSYYKYYDEYDQDKSKYLQDMQETTHSFADVILSTVMSHHNAYEVRMVVKHVDEAVKSKDLLQALDATYRAYYEFRKIVIVCERLKQSTGGL